MKSGRRGHVLILGGEGMFGRALMGFLKQEARFMPAATRRRGQQEGWFEFEVGHASDIEELFRKSGPVDFAVNCIGMLRSAIRSSDPTSITNALIVNSLFPNELAAVASENGTRVIHISTDGVFRDDAARCSEDSDLFDHSVYGVTKRLGESMSENVISLRCSFIGIDPLKQHGLIAWVAQHPERAVIKGFNDQVWNGLTTRELAMAVTGMLEPKTFDELRSYSPVHHLFYNPPITKLELVSKIATVFGQGLTVEPVASGHAVSRVLDSRYPTHEQFLPRRSSIDGALAALHE